MAGIITVWDDLAIDHEVIVASPGREPYRKLWLGPDRRVMCRFGSDDVRQVSSIFALIGTTPWHEDDSVIEQIFDISTERLLGVTAYRLFSQPFARPRIVSKYTREIPSASYLSELNAHLRDNCKRS